MTPSADLSDALAALPLFPLQHVVLFPGALLPLHVFEARYRALVRDVLATHRCLSVVQVVDRDADMNGNPAIAPVAGVGTIVEHAELPGGRYNIVLLGRARVALDELPFLPPYRRARATLLEGHGEATALDLAALQSAITAFTALVRRADPLFRLNAPLKGSPAALCDACANALVLDALERQVLLETLDVGARVRRLTEVLTVQRATLGGGDGSIN
jgi:ATP-dependent Lon protease